ncbi:MAG: hypothetical protein HOE90_23995 [Bacteriovoracaceae bacterium]|jgi:hypothetical protein|nr:hypothetical protein [Bacteriovoracaceae bacterium]
MNLEQAINFLKQSVKFCALDDIKHLDPDLIGAEKRAEFTKALIITRIAVDSGEISDSDLKSKLGLS